MFPRSTDGLITLLGKDAVANQAWSPASLASPHAPPPRPTCQAAGHTQEVPRSPSPQGLCTWPWGPPPSSSSRCLLLAKLSLTSLRPPLPPWEDKPPHHMLTSFSVLVHLSDPLGSGPFPLLDCRLQRVEPMSASTHHLYPRDLVQCLAQKIFAEWLKFIPKTLYLNQAWSNAA